MFSFDEIHGVHGVRLALPQTPPPPRVENGFLNCTVADKTPDFIVNLLSLGCRTLRNKSKFIFCKLILHLVLVYFDFFWGSQHDSSEDDLLSSREYYSYSQTTESCAKQC